LEKDAEVTKWAIRRPIVGAGDKIRYKAPKIQRLITSRRIRRKKLLRANRLTRQKLAI